jgi:hypothetical protein
MLKLAWPGKSLVWSLRNSVIACLIGATVAADAVVHITEVDSKTLKETAEKKTVFRFKRFIRIDYSKAIKSWVHSAELKFLVIQAASFAVSLWAYCL